MIPPIPLPELVLRLVKGSSLTFQEGDTNLVNLKNFAAALQTLVLGIIGESLNEDGTLTPNSVGLAALQNASVSYAALNPATLYQLIPVATDTGTVQNQYQMAALGGYGFSSIVLPGAQYDANGNYTLTGLTENMGFLWTPKPGGNDLGLTSGNQTLNVQGSFTAFGTTALLTGKPNQPVTATVIQSAVISAYQTGQIFFVSTTRANTGPASLSVNGLSNVPILYYGAQLQAGQIGANGIFAVVYMNGAFWAFGGVVAPTSAQGGGGSTVVTTTGFNGVNSFVAPSTALVNSGFPNTIFTAAHGLGTIPTQFQAVLQCQSADAGFAVGQEVPLGEFNNNSNGPAFAWTFDSISVYITQLAAPYVVNPSTGSNVAITYTKWVLLSTASVITNYSGSSVFPSINYEIANPMGAWCYGTSMFTIAQDFNGNSSKFYINQVNTLNNEITPVNQISSATNLQYLNGAVFAASFFGGSGQPQFVFTCPGGIYKIATVNPGTNIITPSTSYNASGTATISLTGGDTYVWSPAANDVSLAVTGGSTYQASSAVNGQITVTVPGSGTVTATMTGSPNTVIVSTIFLSTATWSPVAISTAAGFNGGGATVYKPVWVAATGGTVYVVQSAGGSSNSAGVTALSCIQVTSTTVLTNGGWANNNASALNLTSSQIGNSSQFNLWYPSTSSAVILFFQYNPITQRIYVMTNEMACIHIFQLGTNSGGVITPLASNDFSAWWNTASPGREQTLNYVKSIMLSGMGRNVASYAQSHITVDYDPNSGKERSIVFTRGGDSNIGSITRVIWTE